MDEAACDKAQHITDILGTSDDKSGKEAACLTLICIKFLVMLVKYQGDRTKS